MIIKTAVVQSLKKEWLREKAVAVCELTESGVSWAVEEGAVLHWAEAGASVVRRSCIVQVQFSVVQLDLLHTASHTMGYLQHTRQMEIIQSGPYIKYCTKLCHFYWGVTLFNNNHRYSIVTPNKHEMVYVKIYFYTF